MLIACKYEEIHVPALTDFVDITDNTYTKKQILQMELHILQKLKFDITFPTIYRFLERYHTLSDGSDEGSLLASYLSELCLIEVKMNKWLPSRIAASCIYISRKMLRQAFPWPKDLQQVSNLTERQVRESARELCVLINLANTKQVFEPIFKKYQTAKFMRVALIPVKIRQDAEAAKKQEKSGVLTPPQ